MSLTTISSEEILNQKSIVKMLDDDIVYVYYEESSVLDVSDFKESLEAYSEISQGRRLKVLSEFGEFSTASMEAMKFGQTIDLNASAEAMVFKSLAQRLLLRFFNTFRKQKHPLKFFQSKEKAIQWIKSLD
ncbi:MAG: hypothetical protein ACI857_001491 [Arenicella sp.]|jgi:hypothetical protein